MQNNLTLYKNDIWKMLFKTEMRIFCTSNKIYEFHGMIETDGFGASVILKKRDEENLRLNSDENEIYIEDCDLSSLRNKTIVGIDPNKSELIYASSYIEGQLTKFKYTQKQRNFESKRNIYDEELEELKENALLDGEKVTYWEERLSKYCKKSFNSRNFAKYVKEKNLLNSKLYKFYEQEIFRKFRLFKKINLQRSEDLLINRFCEKFGPPSTTAIAFGDWDEGGGGKHMKFLQPTIKGVGFRRFFRKFGYQVCLVDEFNTSKVCHECNHVLGDSDIMKPDKKDVLRPLFRLRNCANCKVVRNRDANSSCNIWKIAKSVIDGLGRHLPFRRAHNQLIGPYLAISIN